MDDDRKRFEYESSETRAIDEAFRYFHSNDLSGYITRIKDIVSLFQSSKAKQEYLKLIKKVVKSTEFRDTIFINGRFAQQVKSYNNNPTDREIFSSKVLKAIDDISALNPGHTTPTTQRTYEKHYAYLHWIKIQLGISETFPMDDLDRYIKTKIIETAKELYCFKTSGQMFYDAFRLIDGRKPGTLHRLISEADKQIILSLSGKNKKIENYLNTYL